MVRLLKVGEIERIGAKTLQQTRDNTYKLGFVTADA